MSVTKWEDLQTVKKGTLGEEIVKLYLESKGMTIYKPVTKGAHWFDILCARGKKKIVAIDVKTKARLNKWEAQGIDIKHYDGYINFVKTTSLEFYLIFVDDKTGDVHLADIMKLTNPIYPNKKIIAWKLEDMKHLFKITNNQIEELSSYDTRNYKFNPQ